ncbi:50S ribosomal protein L29 [symbiont of Argiope bruennichi]|uniref:50S ribosomal protein L29 n=1 Tax=symbiont of Argiope bruennichi TaxID=2810479 RepID=UPI003DA2879F
MLEKELVNKSETELKSMIVELKQQLFAFNIQKATGKLQDTSKIKKTRKTIAQILTILSLREKNLPYISKYLKDKKDKPKKAALNAKKEQKDNSEILDVKAINVTKEAEETKLIEDKNEMKNEIISVEAKETDEKDI